MRLIDAKNWSTIELQLQQNKERRRSLQTKSNINLLLEIIYEPTQLFRLSIPNEHQTSGHSYKAVLPIYSIVVATLLKRNSDKIGLLKVVVDLLRVYTYSMFHK